jgi:ABC-type transport system involved in multi-copper enzyme maturation permease subunit
MSSAPVSLQSLPWTTWASQLALLSRLDLMRHFFNRRSLWLYVLALAPVGIGAVYFAAQRIKGSWGSLGGDISAFAGTFQFLILRFLVFFGCLAVGTYLVRGEVLHRTLHFYFLLPVRRELFYLSRFAAGFFATALVFCVSVAASYFLLLSHRGPAFWIFLREGQGLLNLLDYLLVTILACAGYTAVFLLASLYVKNPLIPGALFFVWEVILVFLPTALQRISVVYYLRVLSPIDPPAEAFLVLFTTPPDPVPRWVAATGLLLLSAVVLAWGCWRIRSTEVDYSD